MTRRRRNSYTASQKLEVISFAKEIKNNSEAARKYHISESTIRGWIKNEKVLLKLNPKKRSLRRGKPRWIELENKLKTYVVEERKKKLQVSTLDIRIKAQQIAIEDGIKDFIGSKNWCFKFMRRNKLGIRNKTNTGQHEPVDWEAKVESFLLFIKDKKVGIDYENICNMDEVPCTFDIPRNRTVDEVGKDDISIVTTGYEKMNFTIVLAVLANGTKLKPMVIFKRKTRPKGNFPEGIIVTVNPKGWVDTEMMKFWLAEVWKKRSIKIIFKPKSLLICDSARAHLTQEVNKEVQLLNSHLGIIPGGLTKKIQPLDLTVNKSFKDKMKNEWYNWMKYGEHEFTKSNKIKRASYAQVCNWIVRSWDLVNEDVVRNGFKKAGICDYENHYESDTDIESEQIGCDEMDCEVNGDRVNTDDVNKVLNRDDLRDEINENEVIVEQEQNDIDVLVNDLNEKCTIEFIEDENFNGFD